MAGLARGGVESGDWGFKGPFRHFALHFPCTSLGGVSLHAYVSYADVCRVAVCLV